MSALRHFAVWALALLALLGCTSLAAAARTGKGSSMHKVEPASGSKGSKGGKGGGKWQDDEVLDVPFAPNMTSRHYAGYIEVDESRGRRLFWYLVESERDPVNDPLVLWLNGGPGCSSFDGFVYEQGPWMFHLEADGKTLRLENNPHAWSKVANMLFLDSPAGVGMSYSDHTADYTTGDMRTAADAERFLRLWLDRHRRFKDNDFFISGESYAGIYVPNLARAVVEGNDVGREPYINIQGYLVGNGCTDWQVDANALPAFAEGKSLIPRSFYEDMAEECGGQYWNRSQGSLCDIKYTTLAQEVSLLNIYDVLQDCYLGPVPEYDDDDQDDSHTLLSAFKEHGVRWPLPGSTPFSAPGEAAEGQLGAASSKVLNWAHLGITPPCTDSRQAATWLNHPEVRKAIHAEPIAKIGKWQLCSDKISYTNEVSSTIPIHTSLVLDHGLRALIYSGDHDMAVPHTGSETWTAALGWEEEARWQPWLFPGGPGRKGDMQVGGYAVAYTPGLTYATVKGAGHMVPETNPREALAMFDAFLDGRPIRGALTPSSSHRHRHHDKSARRRAAERPQRRRHAVARK